jgi:hypothetical protein
MAKDTDRRRGGFDAGASDGALSGLLADEEELDRGALWRLGTWAAVSVGAVIVALIANQSSIGVRREQSASIDLLKQAQQLQLTSKENQNETRRLASAVDTLNGDRDRLYSRVAVLEQGLDSVTGTIARQSPASPAAQPGASQASTSQTSSSQSGSGQSSVSPGIASQVSSSQGGASQAVASTTAPASASVTPAASPPSPTTAQTASPATTAPATTASIDPSALAVKPTPAPMAAPVTTTAPAVADKAAVASKQDKQAAASSSEPVSSAKPAADQQSMATQPSGSLIASKSMMGPPDPAAGKLLEPATPPKAMTMAALPEVTSVAPKASDEADASSPTTTPEHAVARTEFGIDVGGANSIPGLRALWRGLLRSHSNVALAKLRPIIVIKENNNGLGMQLRLVAGPIRDAAAAAKICASLSVNDRGCSTAVFEGQRLALDETDKAEASKPEADEKSAQAASKWSSRRHYYASRRPRMAEEPAPKPEPSTLSSMIFGKRQ